MSRDYPVNTRRQALASLPLQSSTPLKFLELAIPTVRAKLGLDDRHLQEARPLHFAHMTEVPVAFCFCATRGVLTCLFFFPKYAGCLEFRMH